jgi:hypothetical protein
MAQVQSTQDTTCSSNQTQIKHKQQNIQCVAQEQYRSVSQNKKKQNKTKRMAHNTQRSSRVNKRYDTHTYSMEQSPPSEANQSLQLVKKSPAFLWNPKVPHHTHKCPPTVPILIQLHPIPTTPSKFLKIHLNMILPSTSGSS